MNDACPCGTRKSVVDLVCKPCWSSSPDRLRRNWQTGSHSEQMGRARELLRHARSRRPKTTKPAKQLQLL